MLRLRRQNRQATPPEPPRSSPHRSILVKILSVLLSYLCPAEVGAMRFVLLYVNFIYAILVVSAVIYIGLKYRQTTPPPAPEIDFFYDPMN